MLRWGARIAPETSLGTLELCSVFSFVCPSPRADDILRALVLRDPTGLFDPLRADEYSLIRRNMRSGDSYGSAPEPWLGDGGSGGWKNDDGGMLLDE
jgi:hypothetical protein